PALARAEVRRPPTFIHCGRAAPEHVVREMRPFLVDELVESLSDLRPITSAGAQTACDSLEYRASVKATRNLSLTSSRGETPALRRGRLELPPPNQIRKAPKELS